MAATNTDVVYATTLAHELRHYYDFQISPWGARVQAERLDAVLHLHDFALTTSQAMRQAKRPGILGLPVPLVEWCRAGETARSAFIGDLNEMSSLISETAGFRIPDLPRVHPRGSFLTAYMAAVASESDHLTLLTLRICKAYQAMQQIMHYIPPPEGSAIVQPAHVAEASAVLVQAWEMANITSEPRLGEHLEALADPSRSRLRALDILLTCFDLGSAEFSLRRALAAIAWSLSGDYREGTERANPSYRFGEVCRDIRNNGWAGGDSVRTSFDRWDRECGHRSTFEGIEWRLEQDHEWLNDLSVNVHQLEAQHASAGRVSTISGLLLAYGEVLTDRSRIVSHFLEDPDSYVDPPEFLDSLADLPPPMVRVTSELGVIKRSWLPADSDVFWADRGAPVGGDDWCVSFAFGHDRLALRPGDALRLCSETTIADVLFSSIDRQFHQEDVKTAAEWIGMHLLEFY